MAFTSDWVSGRSGNWMPHLAHLVGKECSGLEIGSHEGRSAIWFCKNILTHPKSSLLCIDPWKMSTLRNFRENLHGEGVLGKVKIWTSPSCERYFGHDRFDFAYVDGEHTAFAVLSDMVKAWEALKSGGVMVVDDYLWPPVENSPLPLQRPIDTFCAAVVPRLRNLLHKGYQVILKKL